MKPTIKSLCAFALLGLLFAGCTTSKCGSCCDSGKCDMKTPAGTNNLSTVPAAK
jgi:hypothetical protein